MRLIPLMLLLDHDCALLLQGYPSIDACKFAFAFSCACVLLDDSSVQHSPNSLRFRRRLAIPDATNSFAFISFDPLFAFSVGWGRALIFLLVPNATWFAPWSACFHLLFRTAF